MEIRPNLNRARIAIIMIWIVMTVEIASLVSAYFQYRMLIHVQGGGYLSPEDGSMNDLRERLVTIVFIIVYCISGVTFIQWFRRAYFNLQQRADTLSYSDGWVAGSWFVPFLNLVRPITMMREMYQETIDILLARKNVKEINLSTAFLGWWWFLWIFNAILSQITNRSAIGASSVEDYIFATKADMVSDIFVIPLAILAVKVISDYSDAEQLLIETDVLEADARIEADEPVLILDRLKPGLPIV